MEIDERSSLMDVAFAVCTALDETGTRAVLTGGSAATYYAPKAYQSRDCDFVITLGGNEASRSALADLGYTERGGIYSHFRSLFTLEFPPGPLSIGSDLITEYETIERDGQHLHVISRTDSVRDRLTAFYFWNDRSSLATAMAVAASGPVNWDAIDAWSAREATAAKIEDVQRARKAASQPQT